MMRKSSCSWLVAYRKFFTFKAVHDELLYNSRVLLDVMDCLENDNPVIAARADAFRLSLRARPAGGRRLRASGESGAQAALPVVQQSISPEDGAVDRRLRPAELPVSLELGWRIGVRISPPHKAGRGQVLGLGLAGEEDDDDARSRRAGRWSGTGVRFNTTAEFARPAAARPRPLGGLLLPLLDEFRRLRSRLRPNLRKLGILRRQGTTRAVRRAVAARFTRSCRSSCARNDGDGRNRLRGTLRRAHPRIRWTGSWCSVTWNS